MKNLYHCYTRNIDNTSYFFVKRFVLYADLEGVPPILEGYGMHRVFEQACLIAGITDSNLQKRLLENIGTGTRLAKIIDINIPEPVYRRVAGE